MDQQILLPHLFRTEYRNIVGVLCYTFGIAHIEIAEDIVSDTFLSASETWSLKGVPENPAGWLYTVAKNKTKNYLRRGQLFASKVAPAIAHGPESSDEMELDLSEKSISDCQLAMIFTVCHPAIAKESQVALALNLLCGFGFQEIADAFLTNKAVIYKRVSRAKEKLKEARIRIEQPTSLEITERLHTVLTTLYLLFSEGYYSSCQNTILRKDFCAEAMRLVSLLASNGQTTRPDVYALLSLMSYHASRFDARVGKNGETILYDDQDETLWNDDLIAQGTYFLNLAASGSQVSKYHIEAGIAYWHTQKADTAEKWEAILGLYNELLMLEYTAVAALNRTFALGKARGKAVAILEAEKLKLTDNHFYYALLGHLYSDIDNEKALKYLQTAQHMAATETEKAVINQHIVKLGFRNL